MILLYDNSLPFTKVPVFSSLISELIIKFSTETDRIATNKVFHVVIKTRHKQACETACTHDELYLKKHKLNRLTFLNSLLAS